MKSLFFVLFLSLLYASSSFTLRRSVHGRSPIKSSKWFQNLKMSTIPAMPSKNSDLILKQIDEWACVKGCGACCKLGPLDSRPDLKEYLTPAELTLYKSMIGTDDWCIHFDKKERKCTQYDTRPSFCQVNPESYKTMFQIERNDFSAFCNFCCREQIADVYGEESKEMSRFNLVAIDFEEDDDDDDDDGDDDDDDDGTYADDDDNDDDVGGFEIKGIPA